MPWNCYVNKKQQLFSASELVVYIWFMRKYETTLYTYYTHIETILINISFKPKKQNTTTFTLKTLHPTVPKQKHDKNGVWPPSIQRGKLHIQAPWWSQHWVSWHPLPPPSLVGQLIGCLGWTGGWWLVTISLEFGGKQIDCCTSSLGPHHYLGWWLTSPPLLKNMMRTRTSSWIMKPQVSRGEK